MAAFIQMHEKNRRVVNNEGRTSIGPASRDSDCSASSKAAVELDHNMTGVYQYHDRVLTHAHARGRVDALQGS